jgi:xanthine dehydrogenase YagT iron-sulfur-binding subunit
MRDDDPRKRLPAKSPEQDKSDQSGVSRRDFLKISGISAAVPLVVHPKMVMAAGQEVPLHGPSKVPMEFTINGKSYKAELEPRVTLLDALRDQFELTGAKRVCDRAECGACTVLIDNKPVYACSVLAIEAQHKPISTVESLMAEARLHPVQQAFVDNDASQCGFCTPGFVVSCKALLDAHPHPTPEEIRRGLSGNLCRCGTYNGIQRAIAQLAQKGA